MDIDNSKILRIFSEESEWRGSGKSICPILLALCLNNDDKKGGSLVFLVLYFDNDGNIITSDVDRREEEGDFSCYFFWFKERNRISKSFTYSVCI